MLYVQTVIAVKETDMDSMVVDVITDVADTLDGYGYPTSKELKVAVLKEALKKVLEKDLTPEF
ncbi:MAG: hypothetical protein IKU42_02885 [Oscillospiraceae bacterium]|nr:hypothetical protein [Oscillospiraceae bacterium]